MHLHRVDGPDDEGEATNGGEEVADLATLAHGHSTAVDDQVPDDDEVGEAGNGVPAPLLGGVLGAESSEETGHNHDDVGDHGHDDDTAAEAGEQAKVEEQEWGGESPVNVAGPVDLAVEVGGGVGHVLVGLTDHDVVVADAVAAGHGEVRHGGEDDDEGRDDVVQTLGLQEGQFTVRWRGELSDSRSGPTRTFR